MNPGSIVRCRNREWVLLPSDRPEVYLLRPLTGTTDECTAVHKRLAELISYELVEERLIPATFPLPTATDVADAASAHLLWQAARLMLREGAAPFRSLGRISIRPRVYQFVPLLMSLRLEPVRLFIADDVGVGKTIEALLIARELYDRGEIKRMCVLCPPYLCQQWASEIEQKFNLEPVIISSGSVGQLERRVPPGKSIYEYFPIQVASIDFVKTDRNRHHFLQFCPELVIVDEVHGAAATQAQSGQERHELLREVAKDNQRHLILLTATPHSGIEEAFRSLLGLLRPEFERWDLANLNEPQRSELAKHFVQRTRADIKQDWERDGQAITPFPERISSDETYELSDEYRELFDRTYAFCSEIVRSASQLEKPKQRVRYWGALALLRCVMSSPAAALAALANRGGGTVPAEEEPEFASFVFESSEEATDDETPTPPVEAAERILAESERRKLRQLAKLAEGLRGLKSDPKLRRACEVIKELLKEGFNPIVWCRYVATAEYVAQYLPAVLPSGVQVTCVTGRLGDEERQVKIKEIDAQRPRVLVATDCLSEGINLQEKFNAVLHYDLPWNPNRLEQREGRVDRFGQPAPQVKAVRFFGRNNPIDGVVIDVLLDKARRIHDTLGTYVPVPEEAESVTQAILEALFFRERRGSTRQGLLDLGVPEVEELHRRWERDAERERVNRTRFAQRALKPEEVQRELEATDSVLGDPDAVREFILTAAQRLNLTITPDRRPDVFRVAVGRDVLTTLPEAISRALPESKTGQWLISFTSPTPEGAEYVGRNHRFVSALARYLMELALSRGTARDTDRAMPAVVCRCGAIRTGAVSRLTTILLLRVRYLVDQPNREPLLAEEILVTGFAHTLPSPAGRAAGGEGSKPWQWLRDDDALRLLAAQPDANITLPEKQELVQTSLGLWNALQSDLQQRIRDRATELESSYKRVRKAISLAVRNLRVTPQFPPDLLGLLVLQPVVKS